MSPARPSSFSRSLWLAVGLLIVLAIAFIFYVRAEKQIDRANESRHQSYLLADELRQTSDDLTRMARSYVVTGDAHYKTHYQDILAIREGTKLRPVDYQSIYWDLVLPDQPPPHPDSKLAVPLLALMRQAGFTSAEFVKLAEAKANSDALTATEFAAFQLIEAAPTEANRLRARILLNDEAYHRAKAGIMRPIDEFHHLMDERTLAAVDAATENATLLRGIFALLGIALMWLLRRSYLELCSALGGRLEQVQSHIAQLGKGDFATPIAVPRGSEESVLGWLAQTQSKLKALQQDNDSAHAKLQRITQLYAALSQCNQAIVRSRDEAELFAIICRDAVNFGGMKMAWIGLLEESGQWVKQVASFGAGIAYLEGLEISLDAESPKGLGPTATAMREDHPFWCQDFQHDPATAAWHERGARFGWAASAALPLHRKGHVIGAFSLYTDVAHAFDEEAQHLLVEMAMDIDFALDHFVDEAQRAVVQQALQEAEEVYRAAFQSSPDTININRLEDGLYLDVNAAFERVSGWTRDEVIGRTSAEINIWHDMADRSRLLEHLQRDGGCENMKAQFAMKDGTLRTCLMSARKITLKGVACILSITRDMSAQEQADARIQQLAHFDQLTGLPNRALLNDRFKYSLSLAQRSGEPLVVMFLDLDHFKTINDTLGHSIGDQLLMEVSRRLKSSLREEDTLSRMGGDEFILVLPGTDEAGARQVAGKLIEAVAHPCQIEQYELVNTISIGIALYPHDGEDFETLSKHADTAMYRVKQASRNDFCFFTQEMQAHSARTLQLLNALRHALARNELALYYQPQIALQDGHIIGAEALLRWTHPELGSISPDEFIPIAEDSGLIIPIGEWVLRSAATQARAWLASGLPPLVVAVNLSAVQFRHPNLTELVNRILAETQLAAEYLELELTEAVAMDDPLAAIAVMNKLHECGIRMSIDDFGTGYSSLSYLKKFQVYKLKIDQSFVRDITDDPDDKAIVSAIINLANSLGMQTIAEGVETSGQLAFLRLQGCDEVQGYYFSKPLPAGEFEQFVKASLSTAAV